MKKFNVTVNGKTYEVEVEEVGAPQKPSAPASPAPAPAPSPAAQPVQKAPAAQPAPAAPVVPKGPVPEGAITVKAPMPGKISAVKEESGAAVKRGDVLVVLEAMKMQNDITATADGTLHEIRVQVGDNVKTGDILAVITQ